MKKVQIETFSEISVISELKYSPDGTKYVFSIRKPNMETDGYDSNLWLSENGSFRQLTYGNKESQFIFLDDQTVLFKADKEKDKPNYSSWQTIDLCTGVIADRFRFPVPADNLILLESGDLLVSALTMPGYEDLYLGDEEEIRKFAGEMKNETDFEVIETIPWWYNGGTFTKGMYHSLFLYHASENRLERLSKRNEEIANIQMSEDQRYVYYFKAHADFRQMPYQNLCRYDLQEKKEQLLVSQERYVSAFAPCQDKVIAAFSDGRNGLSGDPDLYVIDPSEPQPQKRLPLDRNITAMKEKDGKVWLIAADYDSTYLYAIEDGRLVRKTSKAGLVTSFDVHGDDFIVAAQYDTKPHEIYDSCQNQLSHFNERVVNEYYVSVPEPIEFDNDGVDLRGYIMKPQNFDENGKYPALLYIHGGPKGLYAPIYMVEHQYWAAQGYIVLFTNIRGSDGRGGDFADIRGRLGTVDYEDLMKFVDTAIERYPQIDTGQLLVTGGSYGGYMTNWIITHTDRFKAAISQCCISNWISLNQLSDIGCSYSEDLLASDPWDPDEGMWRQSPLKYAKAAKTPTLFLHGFEDYRTPIDQVYQMYTALRRFGVDTRLVLFRGDHHGFSNVGKPSHRTRRLQEMTDWFRKYVK